MKFVLASWGTRGDVEPCAAVSRELLRRGHEARMAVLPDLIAFVESAGLAATAFGPDMQAILDAQRDFFACCLRRPWRIRELIRSGCQSGELHARCWDEMSTTLTSLADGA
ncbi:MAG TPA: glycosyltransferase, partial [Mycobacterium sp.]|uniref:glycosyltransferase n=1 Tax=Mycobacterium sp. TaxID=1785 RepID=UPI002D5E6E10